MPELENADSVEAHGAFNPAVIRKDGVFYMFYRTQDVNSVSRISLATSTDGVNFTKWGGAVISPTEDYELPGGCEDPRIMQVKNMYYLTYTGYNDHYAHHTHTCLATSTDLIHWTKLGPILPEKSTAILNQPIKGMYWAYYGDTNIWIAQSPDMIHWKTVSDIPVLTPRSGEWDDSLVESGPPPILTQYGILLIHNGNLSEDRAKQKGARMHRDQVREYATGWALFDKDDPTHLIARDTEPFLTVTDPFDVYGQVGDVVFTEGLAMADDGSAYLYYGGADTVVNLAIAEPTWGASRGTQVKPEFRALKNKRGYRGCFSGTGSLPRAP
ncbi:MAG: glycosidase [Candidatus Gracilibacteria bacterium]